MASVAPATAGEFLTGPKLRAFTRCPSYYKHKNTLDLPPVMQLVQYVFERMTSTAIRKQIEQPLSLIDQLLTKGIKDLGFPNKHLPQQVAEYRRKTLFYLNELFDTFPYSTYMPIMGASEYTVKVSKTPIKLRYSGLFKSAKNNTLHVVVFTPWYHERHQQQDPHTLLLTHTLRQAVKPHSSGRTQTKLHVFGITPTTYDPTYTWVESSSIGKDVVDQITQLIKMMETGWSYPITSCDCPHPRRCVPTGVTDV